MKVEIYSDVACPWCYVGKHRFERALAAHPAGERVEVVYRPYQLDPEAPRTGVPLLEHLGRRYGARAPSMAAHAEEAARAEGLPIDFGSALAANTLDAHRLMWLAEREHPLAVQQAVAERLFQGHFARGEDIADRDTLVGIAEDAGLDPERARALLDSREGEAEVLAQIGEARALGITAVPTFVLEGRYAVQGAQAASVFLQALETVERELGVTASASGDACDDGSCAV